MPFAKFDDEVGTRFTDLVWLDTVLVRAVQPSKVKNSQGRQCQDKSKQL
jgi:hypothetical protein